MEQLMTSEEVAELLHVDPVTIRRLITKGELGGYRVGADYRFAPADIEAYLRRQRIPASTGDASTSQPDDALEQVILWIRNGIGGKRPTPSNLTNRFDRFTQRARKALTLAQEEAKSLRHNYIGTEHLLLGLVAEGEGVAARVLANLDIELIKVRSAVEFVIGRGDRIVLGEIGLTPRAKKVVELAVDEARRFDHHYIGTEHLLLGLVREGEGVAAGILGNLGLQLDIVRAEIMRVLSETGPNKVQTDPEEEPTPTLDASYTQTCSQCNATNLANFRYCHICGNQLTQQETDKPDESENSTEA